MEKGQNIIIEIGQNHDLDIASLLTSLSMIILDPF